MKAVAEGLPSPSQAQAQATLKHPHHRLGCTCIVCIQPCSGQSPKHKQTCTCNVCQTIKHRFHTLMLSREMKLLEKEAESVYKQEQELPPEKVPDDNPAIYNAGSSSTDKKNVVNKVSNDDHNRIKSSTKPFIGQFDLNIQPEREDELSPNLDPISVMQPIQDATQRQVRQQRLLISLDGNRNSVVDENHQGNGGAGGKKLSNAFGLIGCKEDADERHQSIQVVHDQELDHRERNCFS